VIVGTPKTAEITQLQLLRISGALFFVLIFFSGDVRENPENHFLEFPIRPISRRVACPDAE
jgi:hypothetical protein